MATCSVLPHNAAQCHACTRVRTCDYSAHVQDVFDELEPAEVVRSLKPVLGHSVSKVLTTVASSHAPDVWESLPLSTRRELVDKMVNFRDTDNNENVSAIAVVCLIRVREAQEQM